MTLDDLVSFARFISAKKSDVPFGGIPVICECCHDHEPVRATFLEDIASLYVEFLLFKTEQVSHMMSAPSAR